MKIAVDISPISAVNKSGHKVRGVGKYITLLKDNLEKYDKNNQYIFFDSEKDLPSDIDVIHYPYFEPFFLTLPVLKKHKTVITVHDLTPIVFQKYFPVGIKGRLKWEIEKRIARRVNGIIADSEQSKEDIQQIIRMKKNKVGVAYLAADTIFKKTDISLKDKEKIEQKFSLPSNFILYVGDATWNKNLPRIIKAVQSAGMPLIIAGKTLAQTDIVDNAWNKDLIEVSKEIKKDKKIKTIGFVTDNELLMLYNLANCLLMPSLYEGFGLPILEAMQCGCPVITSKEGSIPEVGDGAVYYVDAYDTKSIQDGIEKVYSDQELREILSKKGIERAKEFTIEKMIKDTVRVYEMSS